jgi:hypothetical protein
VESGTLIEDPLTARVADLCSGLYEVMLQVLSRCGDAWLSSRIRDGSADTLLPCQTTDRPGIGSRKVLCGGGRELRAVVGQRFPGQDRTAGENADEHAK